MATEKCGTHARVSCQTLAHGNRDNEVDKEKDEAGKKRIISMERNIAGTKTYLSNHLFIKPLFGLMVATSLNDFH